jgi:hypothetical protein
VLAVDLKIPIICVDDMNRSTGISQVPLAIPEFLKNNPKYELIYETWMRECYLVKKINI